jgi:hypothetical protein
VTRKARLQAAALSADEVEVAQGRPHGQTKIIRRFALQRNKTEGAARAAGLEAI